MEQRLGRFIDGLFTSKSIRAENRKREAFVIHAHDILERAWERVDEVITAPVWQHDDEAHRQIRTRWFTHGLDQALLALAYIELYGLPRRVKPQNLEDVAFGFMIHDIGKIEAVKPAVWSKHYSEITQKDKKGMQAHVYPHGVQMIEKLRSAGVDIPAVAEEILTFHHERVDGSGKPYELNGQDISFWARLAGCVDSVMSRAENHSYQFPNEIGYFTLTVASDDVYKGRGKKFDPVIMENLHDLTENHLIYFADLLRTTAGWYKKTE